MFFPNMLALLFITTLISRCQAIQTKALSGHRVLADKEASNTNVPGLFASTSIITTPDRTSVPSDHTESAFSTASLSGRAGTIMFNTKLSGNLPQVHRPASNLYGRDALPEREPTLTQDTQIKSALSVQPNGGLAVVKRPARNLSPWNRCWPWKRGTHSSASPSSLSTPTGLYNISRPQPTKGSNFAAQSHRHAALLAQNGKNASSAVVSSIINSTSTSNPAAFSTSTHLQPVVNPGSFHRIAAGLRRHELDNGYTASRTRTSLSYRPRRSKGSDHRSGPILKHSRRSFATTTSTEEDASFEAQATHRTATGLFRREENNQSSVTRTKSPYTLPMENCELQTATRPSDSMVTQGPGSIGAHAKDHFSFDCSSVTRWNASHVGHAKRPAANLSDPEKVTTTSTLPLNATAPGMETTPMVSQIKVPSQSTLLQVPKPTASPISDMSLSKSKRYPSADLLNDDELSRVFSGKQQAAPVGVHKAAASLKLRAGSRPSFSSMPSTLETHIRSRTSSISFTSSSPSEKSNPPQASLRR